MIMKKILLMAAFAVATLTANAQFYIGGSLGFNSSSDKYNAAPTEITTSAITIAPEVGYTLNEKWGIGLAFDVAFNNNKRETAGTSVENNSTTIGVKPYARYQALQWGKANIFVDGGINFGMTSRKDWKSSMDLGVFVTPGIAYQISDCISIVGKINNLFAFGFHKDDVPDVAGTPDAPTRINANLAASGFNVGALSFGVFYTF